MTKQFPFPVYARRLAWEAISPWEQAQLLARDSNNQLQHSEEISKFSEAWCERYGREHWLRRLAAEGLNEDQLRAIDHVSQWPTDIDLPAWMNAISAFEQVLKESSPICQTGQTDIAFMELLSAGADVIEQSLDIDLDRELISDQAMVMRREHWIRQLSVPATQVLMKEFDRWRDHFPIQCRLAHHAASKGQDPGIALYQRFIVEMQKDGMQAIFVQHPLLARRIGQLIDQQGHYWNRLLRRLKQDLPAIAKWLGAPTNTLVQTVSSPYSDPHDGGAVVIALQLKSCSERVFYKPRNLRPEGLLNCAAIWLKEQGENPGPTVPEALLRESYGWSREVKHQPQSGHDSADTYARRAGALLALTHVLSTTDLHADNLIATAKGPVLVDTETVLMPNWCTSKMRSNAEKSLEESVLRTKLLPEWEANYDGEVVDVSGLAGFSEANQAFTLFSPAYVNTDAMAWVAQRKAIPTAGNSILVAGATMPLVTLRKPLKDGFSNAYILLKDRATEFRHHLYQAIDQARATEAEKPHIRYLFRPTLAYDKMQEHLYTPSLLADAQLSALDQDRLFEPFLKSDLDDPVWAVLVAERKAIEVGDVPRFEVSVDSLNLSIAGQSILTKGGKSAELMDRSPLERLNQRLASLSDEDLAWQYKLLDMVLPPKNSTNTCDKSKTKASSPEALRTEALRLAESLSAFTIEDKEGMAWLSLDMDHDSLRARIAIAGTDLYAGATGTALALAAAARETKHQQLAELAARSFDTFTVTSSVSSNANVGLAGLGGESYGLAIGGRLLGREDLIDRGAKHLLQLKQRSLAGVRSADIIHGLAGWLLAALAVDEMTRHIGKSSDLASAINEVAQELRRRQGNNGSWPNDYEVGLCGYAHGASGIAWALVRHGHCFDEPISISAAEAAFRYEDGWFDQQQGNWPDLRRVTAACAKTCRLPFLFSWCHGSPGILLAREASERLGCDINDASKGILQRARQALESNLNMQLDHPCCGLAGQLEPDIVRASLSKNPTGLSQARTLLAEAVERSQYEGGYALLGAEARGAVHPGLFQGAAGMVYTLLRAANPEELPSFLLMEAALF